VVVEKVVESPPARNPSQKNEEKRGGGRSWERTRLHCQIPCEQGNLQGILRISTSEILDTRHSGQKFNALSKNSLRLKAGNFFRPAGISTSQIRDTPLTCRVLGAFGIHLRSRGSRVTFAAAASCIGRC
jgi:hypothetical protein